MSQSPAYKLSPQVQRVRSLERIGEDELFSMVEQSALITHERGNRRFHHWVFQLNGDAVARMTHYDDATKTVHMSVDKDFTVTEEHDDCDGEGCGLCGYIGEVVITYKPRTRNRAVLRVKRT